MTTPRTSPASDFVAPSRTPEDQATSNPPACKTSSTAIPTTPAKRPLIAAVKGYQPTRSEFEDPFPDFCRNYNLPTPTINRKANGDEVDVQFPGYNVLIELDSWGYHQDRYSSEGDRNRDADHLANGTPTVRITWERIIEAPAQEARRLTQILARFASG